MQKTSMEGERKKRKVEKEEEEDEEEKIEKFFALVRSTREVRALLRGNTNIGSKERKYETKIEEEEKAAAVAAGAWNPAFKPEDFLEDDKSAGHHGAGPSKTEEEDGDEGKTEGIGLDLKLSL